MFKGKCWADVLKAERTVSNGKAQLTSTWRRMHKSSDIEREVVRERRDPDGFIIRTEIWTGYDGHPTEMKGQAYNEQGDWVGNVHVARMLYRRGIAPEKSASDHCVCSIGYCEKQQKWYGWSHRAIAGFGIGDRIFEEKYDPQGDKTPFVQHGRRPIKSMEDAKKAAVAFSNSVG